MPAGYRKHDDASHPGGRFTHSTTLNTLTTVCRLPDEHDCVRDGLRKLLSLDRMLTSRSSTHQRFKHGWDGMSPAKRPRRKRKQEVMSEVVRETRTRARSADTAGECRLDQSREPMEARGGVRRIGGAVGSGMIMWESDGLSLRYGTYE